MAAKHITVDGVEIVPPMVVWDTEKTGKPKQRTIVDVSPTGYLVADNNHYCLDGCLYAKYEPALEFARGRIVKRIDSLKAGIKKSEQLLAGLNK